MTIIRKSANGEKDICSCAPSEPCRAAAHCFRVAENKMAARKSDRINSLAEKVSYEEIIEPPKENREKKRKFEQGCLSY